MKYVLRRLGYAVVVLFLASLVTFFTLRLSPGNVTSSVFNVATTPQSVISRIRAQARTLPSRSRSSTGTTSPGF